jgi:hypothetical protein
MAAAEERKALNEVTFREANEKLDRAALELLRDGDGSPVPFLCECSRGSCTEVVLVTLPEYEQVRAGAARGLQVPGHEDLSVERVVARHDRFVVTEKFGRAGEVFAAANPRE